MRSGKGTILDDMEHVSATATTDASGMVTGWSEGARRLTGRTAEEVVGRAARELLAEDPPGPAVAALKGTVVLRHRDGSSLTRFVEACPVLGGNGTPAGYVITARPPGSAEPTLAGQAFQQAVMSMSIFDTRQHYLRLNDVACRVMGVPEEALLGRFFSDSVEDAEHSRGFLAGLRQVAETGRPVRYESFTGAPALNRDHAWTIEMWPVREEGSEELTGVALAAFDNSDQYWARQRLALLNEAAAAIGTTLDVVRTAEELVELLVPQYADFASVDLLDWVLGADEPPTALEGDIVLRRVAHGSGHEGTPRPPSASARRTSTLPPRRPRGPCGRGGRPSAKPASPTSCAGSPSATPAPRPAARTARASTRCSPCRSRPAAPPWASRSPSV